MYSSGWSAPGPVQFGASDYWRLAIPGRELARNGWHVTPAKQIQAARDGTLIVQDEQGTLHDDCDVILWHRWMGEGAADAIRRARATGQIVVNDVDDYYWAIPQSNTAKAFTDPRRNPQYNREIYRDVIKASSLVTVSTPFLKRALERWGPPVEIVPNFITLDRWPAKAPGKLIGWVGNISWRGADLQILTSSVIPWLRERGLPFYHGGHMNDRSAKQLLGYDNVTVRPGVDLPSYPRLWDPLRIALIPIEMSTFGHAKSWVKGLEACARGIPFIATDHPAYRELGVGRLAKKPRDWTRHLDELQDPDVYAKEAAACRARAQELSIGRNWQEWDVVLRAAAEQ